MAYTEVRVWIQFCLQGLKFARESVRVTLTDVRPRDRVVQVADVPCGRFIPMIFVAFEDEL